MGTKCGRAWTVSGAVQPQGSNRVEVLDLVLGHARETPDSLAVRDEHDTFGYG